MAAMIGQKMTNKTIDLMTRLSFSCHFACFVG